MFKRAAIEKSFRASLIVLFLSELTGSIGPLIDGVVIAAVLLCLSDPVINLLGLAPDAGQMYPYIYSTTLP